MHANQNDCTCWTASICAILDRCVGDIRLRRHLRRRRQGLDVAPRPFARPKDAEPPQDAHASGLCGGPATRGGAHHLPWRVDGVATKYLPNYRWPQCPVGTHPESTPRRLPTNGEQPREHSAVRLHNGVVAPAPGRSAPSGQGTACDPSGRQPTPCESSGRMSNKLNNHIDTAWRRQHTPSGRTARRNTAAKHGRRTS